MGRAERRKAAKANGVKGQLFAGLTLVPEPVTSVTLAGAIVAGIEGVIKQGGAPLERSAITIGGDHPEHPGRTVVEVKTDRAAKRERPRLELGLLSAIDDDEVRIGGAPL